jgi:hypothetical protein
MQGFALYYGERRRVGRAKRAGGGGCVQESATRAKAKHRGRRGTKRDETGMEGSS